MCYRVQQIPQKPFYPSRPSQNHGFHQVQNSRAISGTTKIRFWGGGRGGCEFKKKSSSAGVRWGKGGKIK